MPIPTSKTLIGAALTAVAVGSLALPFTPLYDVWAWLVWGREITGLNLDTGAGPSWKPLPVLFTTAFAPAGDAAPELWLVVARIGWLASIALAWRLASRLALGGGLGVRLAGLLAPERVRWARIAAGAVAALGMVLLYDPFTSWLRQFAGGLSEPLLVALVLAAVDRHLSGRADQAFALAVAAALVRPEAWPFLIVYGWWLWARSPRLRRLVVAGVVVVVVLWFGLDLLGSGNPFTGVERAQEGTGWPPFEAVEAVGRALNMVLAGLWVAAGYAVWTARQRGERTILVLAAGALAWIVVVALLAAAGYAGIPRFAAPAAAIACVLGGVGVARLAVRLAGTARTDPRRRALVGGCAALALVLIGQGAIRAADVPGDLRAASEFRDDVEQLFDVVDEVGSARVVACSPTTTSDFLTETSLAWKLEVGLGDVQRRVASAPDSGISFLDADAPAEARRAVLAAGAPLARRGRWAAYEVSCANN
jgi:hypothetical protein